MPDKRIAMTSILSRPHSLVVVDNVELSKEYEYYILLNEICHGHWSSSNVSNHNMMTQCSTIRYYFTDEKDAVMFKIML
jgi:hypothetical protein